MGSRQDYPLSDDAFLSRKTGNKDEGMRPGGQDDPAVHHGNGAAESFRVGPG